METTEELQQLEITALKSIYDTDFFEPPPPKAWKGATRLPEFIIKVTHPDPIHASKVYFHLHIKLPKTYPTLATPVFTIQKPRGINHDHEITLQKAIHSEAQMLRGSEMVFQIITSAQEWLADHVHPAIESSGSLATEMTKRALEEEKERKRREEEEAEREFELAAQRAEELQEQIQADAQRHMLAKEMQYKAARRRAQSDATEVPSSGDTLTESFPNEIEFRGVRFNAVKMFHPRKDPLCDDVNATLPLEVHTISFNSDYYITTQGKKKLLAAEAEIQKLINIQHPNLLSTLAVKLHFPYSAAPPRLTILSEQRPALTLQDVLEDCERLREDRASEYLGQILSALNAVHSADIIHRGLDISCIYLATRENRTHAKMVRIGKVGFHARLKDYHKSNPFGNGISNVNEEEYIRPTPWLSKDVLESVLSYTRGRDIHSVGVIFMQMVNGRDVMRQFSDPNEAVQAAALSPTLQTCALNMLMHAKKVSCLSLLAELASAAPLQCPRRIGIPTTIPVVSNDLRTPRSNGYFGSPENDYFRVPQRTAPASRWKEDWEELELLGRGAFGSVVKARNKIDNRIYAVKKIRLRSDKDDNKLFREVNALSRLSHRFIVRYYTTWVEFNESNSSRMSSNSDTGSDSWTQGAMTSVPKAYESETSDPFKVKLEELDDYGSNKTSFPSIHFTRPEIKNDNHEEDEEDDDSDGDFGNLFSSEYTTDEDTPKDPIQPRTLYIQMEFVERQTLKERVAEGLSEEEAWRLFYQILDALVHMGSMGILHRDIKLTNIFIGDCKVGDFGLATSSLAAVDPSDLSPSVVHSDSELTLEVGTKLYIAPEVQSRKRGPRNHNKADMYSLGIVFFEMNFLFSTGAERIAVLEDLRKQEVYFPRDWEPHRSSQKQIISALLRHDPAGRPSALELSQSSLLPPRVEDEYFKGALRMMTKPDSPYHQGVLSALFNQPVNQARSYLYDIEAEIPEHAYLNDIVEDRIAAIFRLHGAVDMEPPLLLPLSNPEESQNHATLIDRHGEMVCLPNNALVPFARLAARAGLRRIKRFHITNIYRPNSAPGHPKATKAAVLDIITPDTKHGLMAAGAEFLILLSNCLNSFPNLAQNYEIHISHSKIADLALNRIPEELRSSVIEIINQSKSTAPQKRVSLLKKGLLRSTTDELEALAEIDEDIDTLLSKLEKVSPTLVTVMKPAVEEIKQTIQFATSAGFSAPVFFHPLMWGAHHMHFKEGVRIEVVRRTRRLDVLAAAGRYDNLIAQYSNLKPRTDPICAFAVQIALEKIAMALAAFQSTSVKALVKEQRSFGFWSPRRCDVYVLSYQTGYLQDRLEVASLLWQNNISADIMYDANLLEYEHESHVDSCSREGILFAIYPRPRTVRREQPAFKVKSILKGTIYEVSRQDLVGWLQHQIAEQKRVDLATSGSSAYPDTLTIPAPSKDASAPEVQLILPVDTKKQKKHVKQILLDRAYERAEHLKTAVQNGLPMLAVDVPNAVFDTLVKNASWITDEETWKGITASMPTIYMTYAQQIREAAAKRKAEGFPYLLLYATREERMQILTLN
ncbi:kinase-like domain-containing protein [Suillus fuscotomentosus]|uniref:non-specific serine/threonine protein kinase n=1 Tax=Suillus fuscotomentosus TaxID=1912939 RepID=A0AAD4EMF1_9AGAM|nr:kinase-like domain-containing protein [Suillus fuscotomentosus]KAG1908872.1 kinase-like domain-containing protein [Suillus fuscotomentosus]